MNDLNQIFHNLWKTINSNENDAMLYRVIIDGKVSVKYSSLQRMMHVGSLFPSQYRSETQLEKMHREIQTHSQNRTKKTSKDDVILQSSSDRLILHEPTKQELNRNQPNNQHSTTRMKKTPHTTKFCIKVTIFRFSKQRLTHST